MLKIEKDDDYFILATVDFVGLQTVLAGQDQGLNPKGVDQVMLDIYGEKGHNDMHSATSFGTFGIPIGLEVLEFEDDSGKLWSLHPEQWVVVERDGKKVETQAKDVVETDTILDRTDKVSKKAFS